ncbi:hypothetical protein QBC35DRAFT_203075 [Podospora australis]|uniref:Uncharacterized protein n=1 Tax=Podospora australis TaxID=1536484 RepID=A0AAN6X4M8_9PEZI|nr:hypothetical protein QBC35DRAFT_203075 [Podospora australis]
MDIMFSPYGVGGIPKEAMKEIERRTEELLRTSSFRDMTELEKKCTTERLQETELLSIPYSSTTPGEQPSLSPQTERPYLLSPQQHDLMLKAMQRSITLPSLSLTIPQTPGLHNKRDQSSKWEIDEEDSEADTPTNTEPAHKQVKFLEDDAMSDQSSICHSPSWETYGQKKKEKKLEAERRKKEKAQAEKEAKAAKKLSASRLSKLPPSTMTVNHHQRPNGLVGVERSMSEPSLLQQKLQSSQLSQRSPDTERAASTNNPQQNQYHITSSNPLSIGAVDSRAELRRTISEGPGLLHQASSQPLVSRQDGRVSRDIRPPSASRTPMLRHMSPPGNGRSQESGASPPNSESNRNDGYVRYQRAQSCERAMAALADEELFENSTPRSSRSSSRNRLPSRRSSFTQEAKAAAMKLVGIKTTPGTRNDHSVYNRASIQADYFGFPDQHTSSPILSPATSQPTRPHQDISTSERPHTSHSSLSLGGQSSTGSTSSSQSKKSRSLKEAARSALSFSKGTQPSTAADGTKPQISVPPYLAFRARGQSHRPPADGIASRGTPVSSQLAVTETTSTASTSSTQDPGTGSQAGSRVSEGSSASSGYDDGSSIPSPTTTPDTSRPQSARDVPLSDVEHFTSDPKSYDGQHDKHTSCHSTDSSKSSTPRLDDPPAHGRHSDTAGDRWSRTALPLDIDCDAQSFMTTVSNLDETKEVLEEAMEFEDSSAGPAPQQASEVWANVGGASNDARDNLTPSIEPVISIPPRSHKRSHSAASSVKRSPTNLHPQQLQQFTTNATEPYHKEIESPAIRPSKPEQANRKQKRQSRLRDSNANEQAGDRDILGFPRTTTSGANQSRSSRSSSSASSSSPSVGAMSPAERPLTSSEYQLPSNPYYEDLPSAPEAIPTTGSLPNSPPQSSSRPPSQPRTHSASALPPTTSTASRASTPSPVPSSSRRSGKPAPVSILKQPKNHPSDLPESSPTSPGRAPVLSALPKHMQLQAGISVRPPATTPEARIAPIAKMFVECCSCKFYHDMPSKIYECMAKPDAVVEDRALGISGAITTMVKCPWCHHNMSTGCCAGYAAVVYLKEKLH